MASQVFYFSAPILEAEVAVSIWNIITAVFIAFVLKTEKSHVKFRTCVQVTLGALVVRGMGFFLLKRIDAG